MRAVTAIFEDGKIHFPFDYPDREGPVLVLVIFPDEMPEALLPSEEWPQEREPWDAEY